MRSFESAIIVNTIILIIKAIKMFALLRSDEANKIADKARTKAWVNFKARYPNADLSKFST